MKYFNTYFKENDKIQDFCYVESIGEHVYEFNLTKADILKVILDLPDDLQKKIRDKFVIMDFKGGDINHFLDYLLKGHCKLLIEAREKEYEMQKSNMQSI
jgi:hypothetical protein